MADVKRPILLQLGSSAKDKCSTFRQNQSAENTQRKSLYSMDRSSNSSPESSSSSSSTASSTLTSPSVPKSASSELESPSLILPYLYVGDQAQTQIDTISSLNISYILSLQSLPKFLSDSPTHTKPQTQTSTRETTSTVDEDEIVVRPIKLQNSSPSLADNAPPHLKAISLVPQSDDNDKQTTSLESNFDLIDATDDDEGLLPCVNSSKDYLVKIKQSSLSQEQDSVNTSTKLPGLRDESTSEIVLCDNKSSNKLNLPIVDEQVYAPNDCLSRTMMSEQASQMQPSSISGDPGHQDNHINATKSCALKQWCNRSSSSVHRLIRGKCINISDTFEQLLEKFFDETHSFIEEARRNKCNVLVHCKAGISRSPTIAIAYLMKWKRLHLQDAYDFVKRCRPQISPNLNFMGQLVSYERQLQRDRSHAPSPTSGCLPCFNISSDQQQHQQKPAPSESSSRVSNSRARHVKTKNCGFGMGTKRKHMVSRRCDRS